MLNGLQATIKIKRLIFGVYFRKRGIRFYVLVGSQKVAEGVFREVLHLIDEN